MYEKPRTEKAAHAFLEAAINPKGRKAETAAHLADLIDLIHDRFIDRAAAEPHLDKGESTNQRVRGLHDVVATELIVKLRDDVSVAAEPSVECFLTVITSSGSLAEAKKAVAELAKKNPAISTALVAEWLAEWFKAAWSDTRKVDSISGATKLLSAAPKVKGGLSWGGLD